MNQIEVVVTENQVGMRLDAAVSMLNEKISRNVAQTLIKEEKILLDGNVAKVSSKVKLNQIIKKLED